MEERHDRGGTVYGYIRVSTKDQNIARQLDAMKANGIEDKNLFIEKESGKDFNRTVYQYMIKKSNQAIFSLSNQSTVLAVITK